MNNLFQNKRKKTLAICFTSIYTLCLILTLNFNAAYFSLNFRYAINALILDLIPLVTPILVLVFLLTLKKEYRFKKWLFPIAFGLKLTVNIISLILGFSTLKYIFTNPISIAMYICSVLIMAVNGLMFVGSLFNFKYVKLLNLGAITHMVLSILFSITEFISVGGIAYFQNVPQTVAPINFVVLIKLVAQLLFYIGIFILTLKNKNTTE